MEQRPNLKLIAIVSIDLSGYSRMMEQDEFGTHRAVMKCLNEELVPIVAQYRGDLVKSTGDGALITFPSATKAIAGMIAFQQRMAWLGRKCPHDRRLVFRVGIHLAHTISEDGDLYGNGVNLAVRLQEAAEPGSILVSQSVHEHLTVHAQLKLVCIGKKLLKNIKTPIRLHIWSEETLSLPKQLGSRLVIAVSLVFAVCVTPLSAIFSNHIEHHGELSHGDMVKSPQLQSMIVRLPGIANIDVRIQGEFTRDLYYQAWVHYGRNTNHDLKNAIKYLNRIVLDNPDDNASHALLAAAYWSAWYNRWETGVGLTASEALKKARQHLDNVKEPTTVAYMVASEILTSSGRHAEAIVEAERAIAQEPNLGGGYYAKGLALIYYGNPAAAEDQMRIANRLDPYTSRYLFGLAFAQFNMDQFEAAIQTLNRAIDLNSKDDRTHLLLAAASSILGRCEDARLAIDRFNELGMNRRGWVTNHLQYVHSWPFKNRRDLQRLQRGVRLAELKSQYQIASR